MASGILPELQILEDPSCRRARRSRSPFSASMLGPNPLDHAWSAPIAPLQHDGQSINDDVEEKLPTMMTQYGTPILGK